MANSNASKLKVKKLIYILLSVTDRILQLIIPVTPDRICYTSIPDYSDNAYYIFRHAFTSRNSLEHVWLVKDRNVIKTIENEFKQLKKKHGVRGHRLLVCSKRSLKGYWLHLTSKRVFHTHGAFPFSNAAYRKVVINLWHGMPIKSIAQLNLASPNPFPTFGTLQIATSDLFRYIIACAFKSDVQSVLLTSLPRCDALLYEEARNNSNKDIKRNLQIDPQKKLVLWMPTYRTDGFHQAHKRSDVRTFLDDIPDNLIKSLDKHAAQKNCSICVKLHPMDPLNQFDRTSFNLENIRFISAQEWEDTGIQLYDLVAASDALMSDISSVLIDYLVTKKQIGLIGFDESNYSRNLLLKPDLIAQSNRFSQLVDESAIATFLDKVSTGEKISKDANDLANLLYETFNEPGSETILRSVGL